MSDTDFPDYRDRAPWWGGDLQTLRNNLVAWAPGFRLPPGRRLELAMQDMSGDRLVATLNLPEGDSGGRPLVLLIHGLTGCEDSLYMRASARTFLARGHAVLRLNLRGAGPSRCAERYHAGRSQDLRDALAALDPALGKDGLVVVGYSLGANMLLKYLGEEGAAAPFLAAAAVSAPLDLSATSRRFHRPRNRIYVQYILSRIKIEALGPGARLSEAERAAIGDARSVYEFDEDFVAPRNGFASAEDYYAKCMARPFLAGIKVPTLVIQARNDPWIPAAPYLDYDWEGNPLLTPLLPAGGGHVGFHGRGGRVAWHDRAMALFFDRLGFMRGRDQSPASFLAASSAK